MKRKILIDQDLIYKGVGVTSRIELYMSEHNMLDIGRINGKRYHLFDNTSIFIHNTDKHIIVEKL